MYYILIIIIIKFVFIKLHTGTINLENKILKNKISAALLALFFGYTGAHRFYLNQDKKGYKYLFSFTLIILLSTVIYLFDLKNHFILFSNYLLVVLIILLVVSDFFSFLIITDEKFDDKYNGYNSNTYFKEIQDEIDSYYKYIKTIDLIKIKKGDHKKGAYNDLIKELINIYEKMITVPVSEMKLYWNEFNNLQNEINKINISVGDPKINYFTFFTTYLPENDSF
ncbi:TM2 domain-containing membrane protein YozV [Chryseobacterium ginsenosidimutans]|uniref:TM2 domain-containing protein n=1 Tax=Chryseobacterium ginsenosidimutans TaxID=687846 RepID=UPI002787D6D0|nr:TM2 domain-containing protein [Chryseobacterium ginsenosidimutans]MDQ0594616.1 TM2 domain-containing membrane protein YozV [Chryseobacterium ginsenosidimutans]